MANPSAIEQVRLGDHVCWAFSGDDQRLDAMARLVAAGVRQGEKVLYLTESLLPTALLAGLAARGLYAEEALERGQLDVRRAQETYLAGGRFDPDASVDTFAGHIERAHDEGWAGLRIVGDMAWALSARSGADQLARYEARLNRLFLEGRALAVCQYDQRLFSAAELRRASDAHTGTTVVSMNNHWRPLLRMRRTAEPPGLRLAGEADLSNRRALASVLDTLVRDHAENDAPIVIDLADLRFADAAAVGLVLRAGAVAPAGVHVVGCAPPIARTFALLGADELTNLTIGDSETTGGSHPHGDSDTVGGGDPRPNGAIQ
ncbi:MEDS domain-containing protein [Actinomycetes bacterium KLBMP 9797]